MHDIHEYPYRYRITRVAICCLILLVCRSQELKERRAPRRAASRCACARLSGPCRVFEEPGKPHLPTRCREMAIEDGIFAVSAVLNVLLGITAVGIIMKLRRERDAHMRQLHILYGAYMKSVAKLKNMDTSKEGHIVNPAFEGMAPRGDDLEAGHGEVSTHDLLRQSTIDLITDEKRQSLSPWNNFSSSASRRASASDSNPAEGGETVSTWNVDGAEDSDDDAPPGLDITSDDR